jgi:UDPglucose--hexose-1-phosphate uridylyltransferase
VLLNEYPGQTELFTLDGKPQRVTYLTRVDPFSGTVAKISEERARRSIGISVDLQIRPAEKCDFCAFKEHTPKERIEHACGAISVPNKFPWEKYDWITIYPPFTRHKLLLSDLYFDDLERMIESSYELATICARDPEVISFMDFTNWGVFAGASQQHPHSQRKSITKVPSPIVYNEMERCRHLLEQYGQNPFSILEQEERADGRRVVHDDDIFIASAFAPTCADEILVFPKEDIAHIIQATEYDRKRMIQPVLGIFPALFFYRGVTNLNVAVHMATFAEMEEARKYYRWHMHIYPRRGKLPVDRAGSEIGFGTDVIDALPEVTAELLRRWYWDGPRGELVAKTSQGSTDPGLLEEFHRFLRNCR